MQVAVLCKSKKTEEIMCRDILSFLFGGKEGSSLVQNIVVSDIRGRENNSHAYLYDADQLLLAVCFHRFCCAIHSIRTSHQ